MANGSNSLDREGCEYGRITKKQVLNNEQDIVDLRSDIKEEFKDVKRILNELQKTQDKNQFSNDLTEKTVQWTVRAIVVGLISYIGYLAVQMTDFFSKVFK